jgi:lactoylglutathione lyase
MRIAHMALWTRDLDGAAQFWIKYFGAKAHDVYFSKRRPGFISRFVTLPGGDQIELMTAPWIEDPRSAEGVGWDHLAISLGDAAAVDALAAHCDADGLLVSAPRMTGDGFYEAVISTPDATHIEITT